MERFELQAACFCRTGRLRKNNEDNFYFDGRCLEQENNGLRHPVTMSAPLKKEICLAVFDGVGGADFGEAAAFTAAQGLQSVMTRFDNYFVSERRFFLETSGRLNELVLQKKEELHTDRMGTTMTALMFSESYVYVCNLGDSRAYRLRNGEFLQLSRDHVVQEEGNRKGALTQYLGMDTAKRGLEPFVAKGELQRGDWYLICSDGLTDALTNLEIDFALLRSVDPEACVRDLVDTAMQNGGKDNITVIAVHIS